MEFLIITIIVLIKLACASNSVKLSPSTQQLLTLIQTINSNQDSLVIGFDVLKRYPILNLETKPAIQLMLHTSPRFDVSEFHDWIAVWKQQDKQLYMIQCPLNQLNRLVKLKHIQYVEVDTRVKPMVRP